MTEALFTTAYAGHGDSSEENLAAVLDNLLPQNLGLVFIPRLSKRVPSGQHPQTGLRNAVAWLTKEVGETGTIPVDDLIESLLSRAEYTDDAGVTQHDELVLAMVYDPENEADVELATRAHEAGIRVVDLAQAGDDILFEDETEPEAEPEAEVPADEPPFEGGTPIGESVSVKEQIAAAREAGLDAAKAVREASEAAGLLPPGTAHTATGFAVQVTLNLPPESIKVLADILGPAIVAAMGAQAVAQLGSVSVEQTAASNVTPITAAKGAPDGDGPAKDGKPYYYDSEKDSYRPARGMARKTETKVFLTEDKLAEIKAAGLLA